MNKTAEAVQEFLGEEGYRPKYEDEVISFKHEGGNYVLFFHDENDPDFISLNKLVGIELDNNDSLAIYKLLNKVNSQYIIGKCYINDENDDPFIRFQLDSVGSIESFKKHFERYLGLIQQMENDFSEGYNEL